MRRAIGWLRFVPFLVFLGQVGFSQELIVKLPTRTHPLKSRLFSIATDASGLTYAGTSDGLSMFDGQRWTNFTGSIKNRIVVGPNGHLYCMSASGLGKWVHDPSVGMRYVDFHKDLRALGLGLSQQLAYRRIKRVGKSVYFCRVDKLIRVTPNDAGKDEFKVWSNFHAQKLKCRNVCESNGELLVQLELAGNYTHPRFARIENEELRIDPPGFERFKEHSYREVPPIHITELCDWGDKPNALLLAAGTRGAFIYEDGVVRKLKLPNHRDAIVWSCHRISRFEYLLRTNNYGILIVDPDGNVTGEYGPPGGLPQHATVDKYRRLWIATRFDAVQVDLKSGIRSGRVENESDLITIRKWRDHLFFLSRQNLYATRCDEDGFPKGRYRNVGSQWAFHDMGIVNDELFVASSGALLRVDLGTMSLQLVARGHYRAIGDHKELLLVANTEKTKAGSSDRTRSGFEIRTKVNDWKPIHTFPELRDTRQICSDAAGRLWLANYSLVDDLRVACIAPNRRDEVTIHSVLWSSLFRWNGTVRVLDENGELLKFDEEKQIFVAAETLKHRIRSAGLEPDSLCRISNEGQQAIIVTDLNGRTVWIPDDCLRGVNEKTSVLNATNSQDARPLFSSIRLSHNNRIYRTQEGRLWSASGGRFYTAQFPTVVPSDDVPPLVRVLQLSQQRDEAPPFRRYGLVGNLSKPISPLDYSYRVLRFEYSMPSAQLPSPVEYQTKMAGLKEGWSDWTEEAYRDFAALRAGTYTFQVRARDRRLQPTSVTSVPFTIRRPWYQHPRTRLGGAFFSIALAGMFVFFKMRKLHERVAMLQAEISDRTATEYDPQATQKRLV